MPEEPLAQHHPGSSHAALDQIELHLHQAQQVAAAMRAIGHLAARQRLRDHAHVEDLARDDLAALFGLLEQPLQSAAVAAQGALSGVRVRPAQL